MTINQILKFKAEIETELNNILDFWKINAIDSKYGGFVGKIDGNGKLHKTAEKGLVLNCRILWTFSNVYNFNKDEESLAMAHRAYDYIVNHFYDKQHGGLYWSVDYTGKPLNTRKQIYGLAFAIYGLSEYYLATSQAEVLQLAINLFESIEKYSFDNQHGGYFEAFTQQWNKIDDLRLSEKDRNDPKTNNTHLHIIEGYANLYRVWKNEKLAQRILHILDVYENNIIDKNSGNCHLFFSENWVSQTSQVSYGHDIEASWLLEECASVLNDDELTRKWSQFALRLAEAVSEGISPDGSLYHEFDTTFKHLDKHREWWVSAEAMLGFLNAYTISNQNQYLKNVSNLWRFTKNNLIDYEYGEWFWGVYDDKRRMLEEDKIGFWKCPYHNVRACIKIIQKLDAILNDATI